LMVPLYLPLTLDEDDQSAGMPVFFGGINVYLEQKSALFRKSPRWFRELLASRPLLKWASGRTAKTRPEDLGELTLSMLRGEEGKQARELDEMIGWLRKECKPDVICLSNGLFVGLARKLSSELKVPVVCMLQGEDAFLDGLPEKYRAECWKTASERARDVALFGAASKYFGSLMQKRLSVTSEKMRVVYNGINLGGFDLPPAQSAPQATATAPTLGYFARMCREKGLDLLVDAYVLLKGREDLKNLRLNIGGSCGPADQPFVQSLRDKLKSEGILSDVEFHPNVDRATKLQILRSLTVFSVPARVPEAFGLYIIESLAAGVPVVQPQAGAFPELIEETGGGLLCEPENAESLADKLQELLLAPERAKTLGETGKHAVSREFSADAMARANLDFYIAAQQNLRS
jgi:glycosyltransferase involved in cell wall biosynthesis